MLCSEERIMNEVNKDKLITFVEDHWENEVIEKLSEFISIPALSPNFDPDWKKNGEIDKAARFVLDWAMDQKIPGLTGEIIEQDGVTPIVYIEIDGDIDDTVLVYGHIDKQPEMGMWRNGLHPWKAVREGDLLYGRGSADDGYSIFSIITSIQALKDQGVPHGRVVITLEATEESGSIHLEHHMEQLAKKIGNPDIILMLDSHGYNETRMCKTTSLRGLVQAKLHVKTLNEASHSGLGSGLLPSSFTIARELLERIQDTKTQRLTIKELSPDVPEHIREPLKESAKEMCDISLDTHATIDSLQLLNETPEDIIYYNTWHTSLEVIGMDHMPQIKEAGTTMVPEITLFLSLRTSPLIQVDDAIEIVKEKLEENPPYGAEVSFTPIEKADGWYEKKPDEWFHHSIENASLTYYGEKPIEEALGATIGFIAPVAHLWPEADFLVTGVLGINSNEHAPNECLDINVAKKLTCAVAQILADHYTEKSQK